MGLADHARLLIDYNEDANLRVLEVPVAHASMKFDLKRIGGLHRSAPLLGLLFVVPALSLAGLPPLSGFIGKLLILDALRASAALVWSVVLVTSLLTILGFARAGSTLFWKAHATPGTCPPHAAQPLAFVAVFALLIALAGLTVAAGPVMEWLTLTAAELHDPQAYIAANRLEGL